MRMLLKGGMGNGEWGMGNGEWGMGNGEWGMVVSDNTKKLSWSLRSRQRDKDCNIELFSMLLLWEPSTIKKQC